MKYIFSLILLTSVVFGAERAPPVLVSYSESQKENAKKIEHVIVIFQENWSFDGLYGKFPGANGIQNVAQVDLSGTPYPYLPPCIDTRSKKIYSEIPANLPNAPFSLTEYIPWTQVTGEATHRFYQELYQINGGKMNAFAAWSDGHGFVMSYYDITKTRMGKLAQEFALCDNFFHSCYGGSMCGVLWLFSAQMPTWPNAPKSITAKLLPSGVMVSDGIVSPDGYVINNAEPFYAPHKKGVPNENRVPAQTTKTIGDLLSEKGISWGWYAEGWDDALNGKPDSTFASYHQAPSYFKQFAPGTKARKEHLFDLAQFYKDLDSGKLPAVTFIRSLDCHSEHPSISPLIDGLNWCADLITKIQKSPIWKDCAIIVSYDENGGRWDHVAPPIVDQFGPATRIPTLIISPFAKKGFIDHTSYETVSILKFIEERFGLPSLSTRDAKANNLLNAFEF